MGIEIVSSYNLTKREEFLLSFGLDFCLPNYMPGFIEHFLPFGLLLSKMKNLSLSANLSHFQKELSSLAHESFQKLKISWTPFFNRHKSSILKNLSKREDLVLSKPDKGKCTIILSKNNHINKMQDILSKATNSIK